MKTDEQRAAKHAAIDADLARLPDPSQPIIRDIDKPGAEAIQVDDVIVHDITGRNGQRYQVPRFRSQATPPKKIYICTDCAPANLEKTSAPVPWDGTKRRCRSCGFYRDNTDPPMYHVELRDLLGTVAAQNHHNALAHATDVELVDELRIRLATSKPRFPDQAP